MDKETLFMNVKIVKNKNFKLWTKDDIDNILIVYKYKDCYEYYDIVLSLLKKYIDWRKINNISYNYSLINLVNVYLLITESLIINNYVNYYEIYDILHSKSICDMFFSFSSDTLLMIIVILFMIFRICYYIKILTKSSLTNSSLINSSLTNNNDIFFGNKLQNLPDNFINLNKLNNNINLPNVDVFGLNLNLNEDEVLEENEEINNNNEFDIKNIFKDFNLSNFNLQDFDINDFNLQNFDISSVMKKFENNISKKKDSKNQDNSYQLKKDIQKNNDTKNNNLKCECHLCQCRLCNNCLNKKNI